MTHRFLATLAVTCVLAAAVGGYIAIRQGSQSAPVQLVSTPASVETLTDQEQLALPRPATPGPAEDGVARPTAPAKVASRPPVAKPSADTRRQPPPAPVPARDGTPREVTTSRQLQAAPAASASVGSTSSSTSEPGPVGLLTDRGASLEELPAAVPVTSPAGLDQAAAPATAPPAVARGTDVEELLDITIPRDSVVGIQFQTTVSSETASVEDTVEARVTRDVRAGGRVVIPAGTRMIGSVTVVDPGGRFKERARIGVRFHTILLADGTRVGAPTDTIFREGSSPANESAAKVGGAAVGGAILGAILGGGRGAAIGGGLGAAGGTAAVMAGERNAAVLGAGATVTVRLQAPVRVVVADR